MIEDFKDEKEVEENTARILGPILREKLHKHSSSKEEFNIESLGMMSPKFGGESNNSVTMSA